MFLEFHITIFSSIITQMLDYLMLEVSEYRNIPLEMKSVISI